MIQITPKHKVFVDIGFTDFRRGIHSLTALCEQKLKLDPFSGHLFIFRNRGNSAIKILCYDSQGFWLCHKKLSQGKLKQWPNSKTQVAQLSIAQFQTLIWNHEVWRQI